MASPDEIRYMKVGRGAGGARPFHLRWLIPWIVGPNLAVARATQLISMLVLAAYCAAESGHWWMGLIPFGLTGLTLNFRLPFLVDLPALATAAAAAWLADDYLPAAIALSVVAGAMKETAPVFSAAYAWNPWLLVGLIAPALRHWRHRPVEDCLDDENAWILAHPFAAAAKYHRAIPSWAYILPWGALLVNAGSLDHRQIVVLVLAYAQILIATDTVRLYQWATPALVVGPLADIPTSWVWIVLALHFTHPFRTQGV